MTTRRIAKSALVGLVLVVILLVPLIGPLTVGLLLLVPICFIDVAFVKQFCRTGEYVEIGFAWIEFHSWPPFAFYWFCFSVASFIAFSVLDAVKRATGSRPDGSASDKGVDA